VGRGPSHWFHKLKHPMTMGTAKVKASGQGAGKMK
jgi:hypothetical protein